MARVGASLALALITALAACSLAIDLDPLKDGDCAANAKACEGRCVSLTNPNFGCASPGCAPCTLPNAVAICGHDGACALGACVGSYLDCNGQVDDGCEVDITHDPEHCGSCKATPCTTKNGTPGCSAGHCSTLACDTGYGDCNHQAGDGCETDTLTSDANCGHCDHPCDAGQSCTSGQCS